MSAIGGKANIPSADRRLRGRNVPEEVGGVGPTAARARPVADVDAQQPKNLWVDLWVSL